MEKFLAADQNPSLNASTIHCLLSPRIEQSFAKTREALSAASSARTTVTTHTIVAAGSGGRAFINVIIDTLSRNDVAVAVRPDTVTAVLALFERMFGATLAPIGHT